MRASDMPVWMGIDLGNARVGVALSDPELTMAYPLKTIEVWKDYFGALDDVVDLAVGHGVSRAVVGYPLNMDGSEGKSAKKTARWARQFRSRCKARLSSAAPEVSLQDERLTTVSAHQQLESAGYREIRHRPMIDQQSAVLILQAALDARRKQHDQACPASSAGE